MKSLLIKAVAAVFCVSIFMLSACSTVKGVGKDVSRGGHAIERAVN